MPDPKPPCPACASPGRAVDLATIRHLSTQPPTWERAWFCDSPECAVVYFDEHGARIETSGVRVPVFQKTSDPQRLVCYCFGHSVSDVLAADRADGSNAIVEAITTACRAGQDRCEKTNPQGRCCLGNVRGLVRGKSAPDCCGGL